MTNHISREQAEEIAREVLEAVGKNPAESGLVVMTYLEFQASLNYAIDKVIGEPLGIAGAMPGTSGFTMANFKAEDVPVGTELYALKEVKK